MSAMARLPMARVATRAEAMIFFMQVLIVSKVRGVLARKNLDFLDYFRGKGEAINGVRPLSEGSGDEDGLHSRGLRSLHA